MQIRRFPAIDGPILHSSKKTGIVPLVTILFTIKKTVVRSYPHNMQGQLRGEDMAFTTNIAAFRDSMRWKVIIRTISRLKCMGGWQRLRMLPVFPCQSLVIHGGNDQDHQGWIHDQSVKL